VPSSPSAEYQQLQMAGSTHGDVAELTANVLSVSAEAMPLVLHTVEVGPCTLAF
jgi:hypothetical protein